MSHEVECPFIWETEGGERLTPQEMRTSHLFYAVRMIFNHTAPATHQIAGCQRYNGPERWPIEYRRQALAAFIGELKTRKLESWMIKQFEHMRQAYAELEQKRLFL
jgi:hypothetical protein